jgi:hypothetical protein
MDRGFAVLDIVTRVLMVNIALVALAVATVLWPKPWTSALALFVGCVLVGWLLAQFVRGKS